MKTTTLKILTTTTTTTLIETTTLKATTRTTTKTTTQTTTTLMIMISYLSVFNSDTVVTNQLQQEVSLQKRHLGRNETSYANPSTKDLASTGTFQLRQNQMQCYFLFIFCGVFIMSHYEPNIDRIKTVGFFPNCLAFMKAILLDRCHTVANFVIVRHPLALQYQKIIGLSFRQQIFASEGQGPQLASDGRILLQTAAFGFRQPHFASDGRFLLQTAAFCFRQPHFTLKSRILLQTAALCFRQPHFALDSCIFLWTVAFCFRQPRFATDCRVLFRKATFCSCPPHLA